MKKTLLYSALICLAATFSYSCSDDDPTLTATPGTITVGADVTTTTINIACSGDWAATRTGTCISKINPTSGSGDGSITVTLSKNGTTVERTGTVTITSNNITREVTITQEGKEANPPAAAGSIVGATANVCPDNTVALSVAAIANATSYKWYKDGTAISGATTNAYTVTATGTYKVAGVNTDGEGQASPNHTVTITACTTPPSAAGTIQGADANVCPAATVNLTIGAIAGATSYKWYKDGVAISGATTAAYTVTATGTYKVAGVNTYGEGTASPNKTVTITACPFSVDALVGTWRVAQIGWQSTETGWNGPLNNDHNLIMTKVDETTVKITNIIYENRDDAILATVSADKKITINSQQMLPSRWSDADTYFAPFGTSNTFTLGGWPNNKFNAVPIVETAGSFTITLTSPMSSGTTTLSFFVAATEPGTTTMLGVTEYFGNTKWTKVIGAGSPPVNPAAMLKSDKIFKRVETQSIKKSFSLMRIED